MVSNPEGGRTGMNDLTRGLLTAAWLKERTVGRIHTPAFPRHGSLDECPFCGEWYRRHAGFVDHRDECDPHVPTKRGNNAIKPGT